MNCIIQHIPQPSKIFFLLQPFTMGMCYFIPKCSTITTVTELFSARGLCEILARPASHMPPCRSPDTELFCMAISTEATKATISSWRILPAFWKKCAREIFGNQLKSSQSQTSFAPSHLCNKRTETPEGSWIHHAMSWRIVSAIGTRGLK